MTRCTSTLFVSIVAGILAVFVGLSSLYGRANTIRKVRDLDQRLITDLVRAATAPEVVDVRSMQMALDRLVNLRTGRAMFPVAIFHLDRCVATNDAELCATGIEALQAQSTSSPMVSVMDLEGSGWRVAARRDDLAYDYDALHSFVTVPLLQWAAGSSDLTTGKVIEKAAPPSLIAFTIGMGLWGLANVLGYLKERSLRAQLEDSRSEEAGIRAELEGLHATQSELDRRYQASLADLEIADGLLAQAEAETEQLRGDLDRTSGDHERLNGLLRASSEAEVEYRKRFDDAQKEYQRASLERDQLMQDNEADRARQRGHLQAQQQRIRDLQERLASDQSEAHKQQDELRDARGTLEQMSVLWAHGAAWSNRQAIESRFVLRGSAGPLTTTLAFIAWESHLRSDLPADGTRDPDLVLVIDWRFSSGDRRRHHKFRKMRNQWFHGGRIPSNDGLRELLAYLDEQGVRSPHFA